MMRSQLFWAVTLVVVALLGVGWVAYSQEPTSQTTDDAELTEAAIAGYLAPQFALNNIFGDEVSLASFRGKPVVLNFWATWCPPCRAEMPEFQAASVKYNGQAVILGIDQGEPSSIVRDFGASLGITYPLLLDSDNAVSRRYGVTALPQTYFIDSDGIVRETFTGIVNRAVLEDRIEKLLN
jgi:peroxiredoxin